jgi:hypothetical protein
MLEAVADRGYFNGEEIKTCVDAGITVTFAEADDLMDESGRSLRQEGFRVSGRGKCLSLSGGEKLTYCFTTEERGQKLHRYWTSACRNCTGLHLDECHDDDDLAWCENHHPLPALFT